MPSASRRTTKRVAIGVGRRRKRSGGWSSARTAVEAAVAVREDAVLPRDGETCRRRPGDGTRLHDVETTGTSRGRETNLRRRDGRIEVIKRELFLLVALAFCFAFAFV
jgi:hypothetical protein